MSALPLPGWLTFQALAALALCTDVARRARPTNRFRAASVAVLALVAGAVSAFALGALLRGSLHDAVPVSWGALLGTGLVFCALNARPLDWRAAADWIAPSLGLLPGIGRLGCMVVGCDAGRLNGLGLASLPRYPTQALDAALGLSVFALGSLRRPSGPGATCGACMLLYGAGRFLIDGLRDPAATDQFGPLAFGQWMGLLLALAGAVLRVPAQRKSP